MMDIVLFEILTPLGVTVRSTENYWRYIVEVKHPSMANKLDKIKKALQYPDEIRQSIKDETVFLFYKKAAHNRWHCAVIKKPNSHGFLVTAYLTDRIKEGRVIWKP